MLTREAQNAIYNKFLTNRGIESLQANFHLKEFTKKIENKQAYSAVAYIDIYDFSNKIVKFTPRQVRDYLFNYYSKTLGYIKAYNGQIDKLMGDGIIVVFSKVFGEIQSNQDASDNCFSCCKDIVESLYNSDFEVKAAIGNGSLFFCKTGIEQIYEEYTCIGHPLTKAYRLESIAEKNEILLMRNTQLSKRIENDNLLGWYQSCLKIDLKGVSETTAHSLQYYF